MPGLQTEEQAAAERREKAKAAAAKQDTRIAKTSAVSVAEAKKRKDAWRARGYSDGPPSPVGEPEVIPEGGDDEG